jgi:plastocyanin
MVGDSSRWGEARRALVVSVLISLMLMAAACGSDAPLSSEEDSGGTTSGGQTEDVSVTLVAKDNIFEPAEISAPASAMVTVTLENKGDLPHTFTVRDLDVDTGTVDPGKTAKVQFKAPSTDQMFVCTIHELQGQTGQLVIE